MAGRAGIGGGGGGATVFIHGRSPGRPTIRLPAKPVLHPRKKGGRGVKKCGAVFLSVVKYMDGGYRNPSVQVIWMMDAYSLCCTRIRRGEASRKACCSAVFLSVEEYIEDRQRNPSWAKKYVSRLKRGNVSLLEMQNCSTGGGAPSHLLLQSSPCKIFF